MHSNATNRKSATERKIISSLMFSCGNYEIYKKFAFLENVFENIRVVFQAMFSKIWIKWSRQRWHKSTFSSNLLPLGRVAWWVKALHSESERFRFKPHQVLRWTLETKFATRVPVTFGLSNYETKWLTLSWWGFPLDSGPKLAMGKSSSRQGKVIKRTQSGKGYID